MPVQYNLPKIPILTKVRCQVNEEDQLRIISMQKGGDVKGVFERLSRGIKAVQDSVKAESGKVSFVG